MMYMVLMGVGVVLSFLQIFTSVYSFQAISQAVISAAVSAYLFICIYSLYEKVKTERMNPPMMHTNLNLPPYYPQYPQQTQFQTPPQYQPQPQMNAQYQSPQPKINAQFQS